MTNFIHVKVVFPDKYAFINIDQIVTVQINHKTLVNGQPTLRVTLADGNNLVIEGDLETFELKTAGYVKVLDGCVVK